LGKAIIHYHLATGAKRKLVGRNPLRKTLFVQNCSATETVRLSNDLNAEPQYDAILLWPQSSIWLLARDHVHPESDWFVRRDGAISACCRYMEGYE